jgi:hypothetical protein
MELSPSWQAANCADSQKLPNILRAGMDRIDLAQDKNQWRAPVNTPMSLRVPSYSSKNHLSIFPQLRFVSPSGLFPFGFPDIILYALLFYTNRATRTTHLILLDLIILIILGEDCKLWRSPLCSFLQFPVTSSFFGWNILLSTLFSNSLSLCCSLNVRDQFSHPYRTRGKIIILYILIFMFLDSRCEDRSLWTEQPHVVTRSNSSAEEQRHESGYVIVRPLSFLYWRQDLSGPVRGDVMTRRSFRLCAAREASTPPCVFHISFGVLSFQTNWMCSST